MITLTDSISSILGVKVHNVRLNVNQGHQLFNGIAMPAAMEAYLTFSSFEKTPIDYFNFGSLVLTYIRKIDNEYHYRANLLKGENTALIFKQLAEVYAV